MPASRFWAPDTRYNKQCEETEEGAQLRLLTDGPEQLQPSPPEDMLSSGLFSTMQLLQCYQKQNNRIH